MALQAHLTVLLLLSVLLLGLQAQRPGRPERPEKPDRPGSGQPRPGRGSGSGAVSPDRPTPLPTQSAQPGNRPQLDWTSPGLEQVSVPYHSETSLAGDGHDHGEGPSHEEASICGIGTYGPACAPCPFGSFQDLSGSRRCQHCPFGSTTPSTGASSIESCTVPMPKENSAEVVLIMGLDFDSVVTTSEVESNFRRSVAKSIGYAVSIPMNRLGVTSLLPGSVIAKITILDSASGIIGEMSARAAANEIVKQARDPNSILRGRGVATSVLGGQLGSDYESQGVNGFSTSNSVRAPESSSVSGTTRTALIAIGAGLCLLGVLAVVYARHRSVRIRQQRQASAEQGFEGTVTASINNFPDDRAGFPPIAPQFTAEHGPSGISLVVPCPSPRLGQPGEATAPPLSQLPVHETVTPLP